MTGPAADAFECPGRNGVNAEGHDLTVRKAHQWSGRRRRRVEPPRPAACILASAAGASDLATPILPYEPGRAAQHCSCHAVATVRGRRTWLSAPTGTPRSPQSCWRSAPARGRCRRSNGRQTAICCGGITAMGAPRRRPRGLRPVQPVRRAHRAGRGAGPARRRARGNGLPARRPRARRLRDPRLRRLRRLVRVGRAQPRPSPRPVHRVDIVHGSQQVRVELDGEVIAE